METGKMPWTVVAESVAADGAENRRPACHRSFLDSAGGAAHSDAGFGILPNKCGD